MDEYHILPLLGLARKGNHLVLGEEAVEDAARQKDARLLLLASDAAENTRHRTEQLAELGQCLWLELPFQKEELGRAAGRAFVAVAALTDLGLANALAKKLAAWDPERYAALAERLQVKAQRAARRKEERRARTQERRTGNHGEKPDRPGVQAKQVPGGGKARGHNPGRGPGQARKQGQGQGRPAGAGPGEGRNRMPAARAAPTRGRSPAPTRGKGGKPRDGGGDGRPRRFSRPVKKGKGSFRKREDGRS